MGNILTDNNMKLERWKEHFEETLNRPEPTNPIEYMMTNAAKKLMKLTQPASHKKKSKKELEMMKNGKASGKDGITAELLKADVGITSVVLEDLFQDIWRTKSYPKIGHKELLLL